MDIFPINDHWVCDSDVIGASLVKIADLSGRQQRIDARWEDQPQICQSALNPFVLNWLDKRATSDERTSEVDKALKYLAISVSSRGKTVGKRGVVERSRYSSLRSREGEIFDMWRFDYRELFSVRTSTNCSDILLRF